MLHNYTIFRSGVFAPQFVRTGAERMVEIVNSHSELLPDDRSPGDIYIETPLDFHFAVLDCTYCFSTRANQVRTSGSCSSRKWSKN
jgi:hypothetical protein